MIWIYQVFLTHKNYAIAEDISSEMLRSEKVKSEYSTFSISPVHKFGEQYNCQGTYGTQIFKTCYSLESKRRFHSLVLRQGASKIFNCFIYRFKKFDTLIWEITISFKLLIITIQTPKYLWYICTCSILLTNNFSMSIIRQMSFYRHSLFARYNVI